MILLLITILLIAVVIYNQFIKCDKEIDSHEKKKKKNKNKKLKKKKKKNMIANVID